MSIVRIDSIQDIRADNDRLREELGIAPLPPVTHRRTRSLNTNASGPGGYVLPRGGWVRGFLIMTVPAAVAGAVFASLVWLLVPSGGEVTVQLQTDHVNVRPHEKTPARPVSEEWRGS